MSGAPYWDVYKAGLKKKAAAGLYSSLMQLKFAIVASPLVFILELLERLKPSFKLEHCFPGRLKVVYPKVVRRYGQYSVALTWLRRALEVESVRVSRIRPSFSTQIFERLMEIHELKRHRLFKKRNQYHQEAVTFESNVRYTWRYYN